MAFSKNKFKFVDHQAKTSDTREIIAIREYLGKTIKGSAKCDPRDAFDSSIGEELAARRCNFKIAKKRLENANIKVETAQKALAEAQVALDKALNYHEYASKEYTDASNLLINYTKELN